MKKGNKIIKQQDNLILYPTNSDELFICDLEDYNKIKIYTWYKTSKKFLATSILTEKGRRLLYLHKYLLNIEDKKDKEILFEDGNFKNLCKSNLTIIPKYSNKKIKGNRIEIINDIIYLYVSNSDIYKLDIDDFEQVSKYTWRKDKDGYLITGKNPSVRLTKFLIKESGNNDNIKFINENKYDYRKSNLHILINRRYKPSVIIERNEYIIVIPTNTDNQFIFDKDMKEKLEGHGWYEKDGYISASINGKDVRASHLVVGKPPRGFVVDHINNLDTYDNRRNNLRIVTYNKNNQKRKLQSNNTSGFVGVNWNKQNGKWMSRIKYKYEKVHLGYFDDIVKAAQAYDKKALEIFGEYATTNKKLGLYEKYYNKKGTH